VRGQRNSWQATIYADARLSACEIATYLVRTLRGSVSGASADLAVAERIDLDVTPYDKRPPSHPVDEADAFLQFPYEIEVFTDEPFDREAVVADVSAVLAALDELGIRYVATADFEDQLPGGGRNRA
jgi:hypothetical protein